MKIQKYILTKGLQGSGKSTWAKKEVAKDPHNNIRICRDDFRHMLNGYVFDSNIENIITKYRNDMIFYFLDKGYSVIVDETGLNPKTQKDLELIGRQLNIPLKIQDFTDVTLETCIERDSKRENPVGKKVITEFYYKYIYKRKEPPVCNPNLPSCVICDLDGTLAIIEGLRNPYDASKCDETDLINETVHDLLELAYKDGSHIIFVSGREERYREPTIRFLDKCQFSFGNNYNLFMRRTNDPRKDWIIKEEIYKKEIEEKYSVRFLCDDRKQVIDNLWRKLGFCVFNVGDGRDF